MKNNNIHKYIKKKKLRLKIRKLIRKYILPPFLAFTSLFFLATKMVNSPNSFLEESRGSRSVFALDSIEDTFTVCLDAGHGDWDVGAIGSSGSYEKDIVLSITLLIGEYLAMEGIDVVYTRTNDSLTWTDISTENLYERVDISTSNNSDLFISLHCNSSEYYEYNGIETWYASQNPESKTLATLIQDELSAIEYTTDRGIKEDSIFEPLAVLNNNPATAVLVELGFISNWSDEYFLLSPSGQVQCAQAIANGIISYKNSRS